MTHIPTGRVEEAHQHLLGLVHPTSLSVGRTPHGEPLAFVAPAGEDEPAAVHLLPLDGSGSTDPAAAQVLRLGREPALVRWTVDGHGLWGVCIEDGEPSTVCLRAADSGAVSADGHIEGSVEDLWVLDDDAVLLRVADPGSDRDGMHLGIRVTDSSDPRVDSPGRRLRRLVHARVDGDRIVTTPLDLDGWTVWDADVRDGLVAVVGSRDPLPAGYYLPSLLVAELDGAVLRGVREVHRTDGTQLARPRIAADRSCVLVLDGLSIVSGQVLRVSLESPVRGDVAHLSGPPAAHLSGHLPGLDDVTDLGQLPDGRWWFTGWHGTGVQVGTFSHPGADSEGDVSVERWAEPATAYGDAGQPGLVVGEADGADHWGYTVWEAPGRPAEVVRVRLDRPGVEPLTSFNSRAAEVTELADAVTTTEVGWDSPDGTRVEGLLLRPADRDPAAGTNPGPLPLVLLLHGGPTWLWSAAFAPGESNQMALPLAAAGAAVLLPNPRGSSGRGQDHARAIIGHMGTLDLDDVVAGVDHLVDAGVADPSRVAVMGLSYGGYLTAVAATRTDRFRAAVVMSGVSDWLSFVTTSALGSGGSGGGYDRTYHPDADPRTAAGREVLAGRSPVYEPSPHPTPTLLLHGVDDRITPLSQAEQLYRSLTAAGVPAELAAYAGEGHELTDPGHQTDACARILDWLTRHGVLG